MVARFSAASKIAINIKISNSNSKFKHPITHRYAWKYCAMWARRERHHA